MAPAATNHLVKLVQLSVDMQSTDNLKCLSVENMEQVSCSKYAVGFVLWSLVIIMCITSYMSCYVLII